MLNFYDDFQSHDTNFYYFYFFLFTVNDENLLND